MKIGFIGLGIMGAPMALRLAQAGHELHVDASHTVPASVAASSPVRCSNAAEVTQRSEVIFVIVPDTPDVEAVLFGDNGVAQGLAAGGARKVVVDMSSISPTATK